MMAYSEIRPYFWRDPAAPKGEPKTERIEAGEISGGGAVLQIIDINIPRVFRFYITRVSGISFASEGSARARADARTHSRSRASITRMPARIRSIVRAPWLRMGERKTRKGRNKRRKKKEEYRRREKCGRKRKREEER